MNSSPLFAKRQSYASIVMDAQTGEILNSTDPDGHRFPASLTKMLTLYIVFNHLKAKKITMRTTFRVPPSAPLVEPSKLGLKPGQMITVKDLVLALITKSANDAAVTIAVGISGSIHAFATLMNQTCKKLGMTRSRFYNPHGLPHEGQHTTARDMAILSKALIRDFPHDYLLFKTPYFHYKGCSHHNHNRLLGHVHGLDGIKTGWFRRAGSCLAASAVRKINGRSRRLIAVVLGAESRFARDKKIQELLNLGFSKPFTAPSKRSKDASLQLVSHASTSPQSKKTPDPIGDLIHHTVQKNTIGDSKKSKAIKSNPPTQQKIKKPLKKIKNVRVIKRKKKRIPVKRKIIIRKLKRIQ